jgi:hypothetical protein
VILLALIGATAFFLVHQFSQNVPGSSNTTRITIHWQRIAYNNASSTVFAAPGNPAMLYMCGYPSSSATDTTDSSSESSSDLMRSTDAGVHWRVITTAFPGDIPCIIAINPANADDLYTVGISFSSSSNFQNLKASSLLSHSSNGGEIWTKVAATLLLSSGQRVAWAGDGLAFIGHRLFAKQELHGAYHLISSSDGGRTWTVVDAQLFEPHQELHSYTVDPSMPNTIYELVGPITGGWFSYAPVGTPVPTPTPTHLSADELFANLYKTADGGATWQKLPVSVPYGTNIQLVRSNPRLLYVSGRILIDHHYIAQVQSSRDGGATWQTIVPPTHTWLSNSWFVDTNDLFYDLIENTTSPKTGNQALTSGTGLVSIQRYNPSTGQWSTLNIPAGADSLLAITPDTSHNGDILWMANLDGTLFYRGTYTSD